MSGGGGTNTVTQTIPPQFLPAYLNLFDSAIAAARGSAGQQGYGAPTFPSGSAVDTFATPLFGPGGTPMNGVFNQGGGFNPYPSVQQNSQQFGQAQQFGQVGQGQPQQGFGQQPQQQQPQSGQGQAQLPQDTYTGSGLKGGVTEAGLVGSGLKQSGFGLFPTDRYPNIRPELGAQPIVGQTFPGPFISPTQPIELESLALREAAGRQATGAGSELLGLGRAQAGGAFLSPQSNPFLQESIQATIQPQIEAFSRNIMPQFDSAAINAGAFKGSSAREFAQGNLVNDFWQNVANPVTQAVFGNYQNERGLQQQAGGLISQGIQLQQAAPEILAQTGAGQRDIGQRMIDEQRLRLQELVNAPYRPLLPLANIIQGTNVGGTQTSEIPAPSPVASGVAGALGGAALGAGVNQAANLQSPYLSTGLGALLGAGAGLF